MIPTNPVLHLVSQRFCDGGHFLDFPIRNASANVVVAHVAFLADFSSRERVFSTVDMARATFDEGSWKALIVRSSRGIRITLISCGAYGV